MSCAELPEVSSLSEYDETSEQPFEHFRVCAVRAQHLVDVFVLMSM